MKKTTSDCMLANLKKQILLTFFVMLLAGAYAQKTSTGNGAWNNAATWTPAGVPGNNDDVTIAAGHTVTVPANATCKRLYISGTLNMTGTGITMDITNNSVASPTNGLQLNAGSSLTIGATNTLYFSGTQAAGIVNNGGTIVSTGTNGVNGGTIRTNSCCGGEFRISGSAATTVYNLEFLQNANFNISTAGFRVNGKLSMDDNNWNCSGSPNSPIYGPGSTLHINWNGQGISSSGSSPLNNNLAKLWNQSTGTIGVTAGYPNNVTILNVGTSNGNVNVPPNVNVGWRPGAMAIGLNGALQIGDASATGTNTGFASLDQVTSFSSGGVVVDNSSVLIGPPTAASFTNRGNFTLQGGTTGLFYSYGATMNLAGSGTVGSPQIISTTSASAITFAGLTVSNGTYVRLDDDVNVTGTLTLTSGYVGTSATNSLTITNTASNAISGGSSTAYIDGPLIRSLPGTTSGDYVFPIGDLSGGAYLPLTFSSANSSGGTNVTAEAFNTNSNGKPDLTISAISPTEYWAVSTTNPFSGSTVVDATRPTAVSPYNALGTSSTVNGFYTVAGGSPSGTSILNGGLSSSSPIYIAMVNAFLNPVRIGGTNASVNAGCVPTMGSLVVGGVGGTPGYTYSVAGFNGGAFQASNTFSPLAKGSYSVTIKDNLGATETKILKVLGPVQINGNDQDIDICSGESVTLTASNLANSSATYSWSPGGATSASIVVSPTIATTYTVTSTIYANNLITNGSFESGTPTGFDDHYDLYAGAPYGTTPDDGGYYSINDAGTDQCTFFTNLAAQNGTKYFIGDANNNASDVFSLNLGGLLSAGTVYRFSYWYAKGSNDHNPGLQTFHNGASLGTVSVTDYTAWTQVNYSFTATGADVIRIRNTVSIGSTNGNDFYIDNIELLAPCVVSTSIEVTTNCTLPVELIDFKAVRQGSGALLTWETASEINSSHFIIEKSTDGITFSPIGKVDAAGNSEALVKYSFTDPFISTGVTYYRLAQYDLDGAVHYSEVRAVSKNESADIQVAPNPNNGIFLVTLTNRGETESRVSIVSSLGQVVYVGEETLDNQLSVDISHLASAVYYLQVHTSEGTIVEKIVKQ